MSSSRDEPSLQEVSPTAGQAYLKAVLNVVIREHACLLGLLQGTMPTEMLEFPETVYPNKLARRKGTFKDAEGNLSVVSQTMNDYREELIQERTNELVSREEALQMLFPDTNKQARDRSRQNINAALQFLFGKLVYLWPRTDISEAMIADADLTVSSNEFDLISWHLAFLKFCSTSSGNSEVNIRQAENKISRLKLSRDGYLDYAKEFKLAAENLKICKSSYTEERIVSLYFENLDQSDDRFYRWHLDFLTEFHG